MPGRLPLHATLPLLACATTATATVSYAKNMAGAGATGATPQAVEQAPEGFVIRRGTEPPPLVSARAADRHSVHRQTGKVRETAAGGPPVLPSSAHQSSPNEDARAVPAAATEAAQRQLHQTFSNLEFVDFGPAPVKGPLYQASAGGRIIYFAPQSQHLLFGAVYDRDGVNLTARAQDAGVTRRLAKIDTGDALLIGPPGAPQVIEFTDPDCPYCQALERFWAAKAIEGKPVQRLVYFVSGIHPQAAAKAEHILCSPDPAAAFKAIYGGAKPPSLLTCRAGADKVAADARAVSSMGISGTPTLVVDGQLVAGFQQGELEAFLARRAEADHARR